MSKNTKPVKNCNDNDRGRDRDYGRNNNYGKHCEPAPKKDDCDFKPKPKPCKEKLFDLDDCFWGGKPVCEIKTVEKSHKFKGNEFPNGLVEGQAIGAAQQAALGELSKNMQINGKTTITGEITLEVASFNNSLGAFVVDKCGNIKCAEMLIENTNDSVGTTFSIDAPAGAKELGFFVISNGNQMNNGYEGIDFSKGTLNFYTNYGTPQQKLTNVADDGTKVSLVFTSESGEKTVLQGSTFFTSDRGGENLNPDGMVHTLSGVDGDDCKTLTIAFEDRHQLVSDKDYNDVVFNVKMTDEVKVKDCNDGCNVIDFCDKVTDAICDFVNKGSKDKWSFGDGKEGGDAKAAAVLASSSVLDGAFDDYSNQAA
jgi:hypothetical protein